MIIQTANLWTLFVTFFVAQRKEGILALHTTNLPSFLDVYFLIKTIIFYQTVCVENNPIFPKINEN